MLATKLRLIITMLPLGLSIGDTLYQESFTPTPLLPPSPYDIEFL